MLGEEEPSEDCGPIRAGRRKEAMAFPLFGTAVASTPAVISFDREELREIFNLYGRKVCDGEWRDYGIDFSPQKAVFSIYRRACECALYRIEKLPRPTPKQGAYSVITATGLILKRGHDLARVISVLDSQLKLVSG